MLDLEKSKLESGAEVPRIFTVELKQDDPAKCTSAKMAKFRLARPIRESQIPRNSVVLTPFSELIVIPGDRDSVLSGGLTVIDCSWERASNVSTLKKSRGIPRKLPALLAGNPTNYAKLHKLSSLEACAAALYITNFKEHAQRLLSLYKWGDTFLSLNRDPLEDYSRAESQADILNIQEMYFRGHV